MIELFFSIFVVAVTIYGQGLIFNKIILKQKILISNFFEKSIFGIIFLSFNILLINFFIPINKFVGTTILVFSLVFFFYEMINNKKQK